jgi:hypothetical protein
MEEDDGPNPRNPFTKIHHRNTAERIDDSTLSNLRTSINRANSNTGRKSVLTRDVEMAVFFFFFFFQKKLLLEPALINSIKKIIYITIIAAL